MVTWIACIAILLNSLAPAFAASGQLGHHAHWHELCHDGGTLVVFVADEEPQAPESHGDHGHCPLCCGHGHVWALPPTLPEVSVLPRQITFPRIFFLTPHIQHVWQAAQPRGPPAHS